MQTYLTASDVARVLRVRPSAVANWQTRDSGPLPRPRAYAGTSPLWSVSDIRRLVQQRHAEDIELLDAIEGRDEA